MSQNQQKKWGGTDIPTSAVCRLHGRFRELAPHLVPLDYTNNPDIKVPLTLIITMPELKVQFPHTGTKVLHSLPLPPTSRATWTGVLRWFQSPPVGYRLCSSWSHSWASVWEFFTRDILLVTCCVFVLAGEPVQRKNRWDVLRGWTREPELQWLCWPVFCSLWNFTQRAQDHLCLQDLR